MGPEVEKARLLPPRPKTEAELKMGLRLSGRLGAAHLEGLCGGVAFRSGNSAADETGRLFQALSIELQRENARAVLRRSPEAAGLGRHLADPFQVPTPLVREAGNACGVPAPPLLALSCE